MQSNTFIVTYNKGGHLNYIDLNIDISKELPCIPLFEDMIVTALFIDGYRVYSPLLNSRFTQIEMENFFSFFTQQERYILSSEFFDSTLIKDSEYRKQNSVFCPKFLPPPTFDVIITGCDTYGLFITPGEAVTVFQSYDGITWNMIGGQAYSNEQRRNHQPFMLDCFLKLSNSDYSLYSPVFHYVPAGGGSE